MWLLAHVLVGSVPRLVVRQADHRVAMGSSFRSIWEGGRVQRHSRGEHWICFGFDAEFLGMVERLVGRCSPFLLSRCCHRVPIFARLRLLVADGDWLEQSSMQLVRRYGHAALRRVLRNAWNLCRDGRLPVPLPMSLNGGSGQEIRDIRFAEGGRCPCEELDVATHAGVAPDEGVQSADVMTQCVRSMYLESCSTGRTPLAKALPLASKVVF